MKKVTMLLAILALTLVAVPAFADSVINGNFQTGDFTGWTQNTSSGHTSFLIGDSYYAQSDPTRYSGSFKESAMFQIVDVAKLSDGSANPAWNPAGTSEDWSFSFNYTRPDSTTVEYQLYYWTGTGTPTTFSNDSPSSSWTKLWDVTSLSDHSGTVTKSGTITGCQPEYFAIGFEAKSNRTGSAGHYTYYNATIDNVVLSTECHPAVPVPPAVWLMGTGLVGLFGLRRRFSLNA